MGPQGPTKGRVDRKPASQESELGIKSHQTLQLNSGSSSAKIYSSAPHLPLVFPSLCPLQFSSLLQPSSCVPTFGLLVSVQMPPLPRCPACHAARRQVPPAQFRLLFTLRPVLITRSPGSRAGPWRVGRQMSRGPVSQLLHLKVSQPL